MQPKVIRVLEAYEKDGDAFLFELPLRGITLAELQVLFNVPEDNPMYDAWLVEECHVAELQPHIDSLLDLRRYSYYIAARSDSRDA